MNLNDLLVLKAIAEKGTLVAAADQLDMPTSTLSRRLGALEQSLATKLVTRTSRSVRLTEAGMALYQQTRYPLQSLLDSPQALQESQEKLQGRLRVACPIFLSYFCVAPWMGEFQALHPDLEVELRISNHIEDIWSDQFDLAIRPGPLKDSTLIAKPLFLPLMQLYASPNWVKQHGLPDTPEDLHHQLALADSFGGRPWTLTQGQQQQPLMAHYRTYSNDFDPICEALMAGLGFGALPKVFGDGRVREGRLVTLLPQWQVQPRGMIYAVYPTKEYLPKKTQTLLAFLQQKFSKLAS